MKPLETIRHENEARAKAYQEAFERRKADIESDPDRRGDYRNAMADILTAEAAFRRAAARLKSLGSDWQGDATTIRFGADQIALFLKAHGEA